MAIKEWTIIASERTIDVDGTGGPPLPMNAEVYDGDIPGPTLELDVGDTAVVRLINDLPHPTGIHWHGIELHNSDDGTPVTQYGVPGAPLQTLGNGVPAGGTYLYRFTVTRPGIFWYHPHHFHSTNRTFRGLYGMIVVRDPVAEAALAGVLPTTVERLVLSDTTICKTPGGGNDTTTYPAPVGGVPEWLSGQSAQLGPTPLELCETAAMDEEGNAGPAFAAADVPNIQINSPGRSVEGQTVLVNGRTVVPRGGTPAAPDPLASGSITVQPGQGLRLQIVNCAVLRYFRLHLSDANGNQIPLIRVGGEGGLLNEAVVEGGSPGGFDTKYDTGEILLPPSTRADVVAAVPDDVSGVLTLWTRDFQRTGGMNPGNWALLPTVPVFHIEVAGTAVTPAYSLSAGDSLLAATAAPLTGLGAATGTLLDPAAFGEDGTADPIGLGPGAGINGVPGAFDDTPYTANVHLPSSRWARDGDVLHLAVSNDSAAHHPFHLHGFSFQPVSIEPKGGGTALTLPLEFRDSQDIPPQHVLNLRVHLSDRVFPDGSTTGGALGRWLFHCHIFFHAHLGMLAELVVTDSSGTGLERPHVDVGGSWAYAPLGGIVTRSGTYHHRDGLAVALSASEGTVVQDATGPGTWSWSFDTTGEPADVRYVYITGEDPGGRRDQAAFRMKIGAPDDGSDNGDPHLHTVNRQRYDFQSVGEFILLRDRDGLELQVRQSPVPTANPLHDSYSGLEACVSLNTAFAARVGGHRIAFQPTDPGGQGAAGIEHVDRVGLDATVDARDQPRMRFYIDGRLAQLDRRSYRFDGNVVSGFDAGGETALRIDYAQGAVVLVTPHFWTSHQMWYLNISVAHTQADEGLMGPISRAHWLPRLPDGRRFGARPKDLDDRYVELYRILADAWRVTDRSSLFVYAPGTSTATFTDRDWPAQEPPCTVKPGFEIPGAPVLGGMDVAEAEVACQIIGDAGLKQDCIFDVATTGDAAFASAYRLVQDIRRKATALQVVQLDRRRIVATVTSLVEGQPPPHGAVRFELGGRPVGAPVPLDSRGRAEWKADGLAPGIYDISATFMPDDGGATATPSKSPVIRLRADRRDGAPGPQPGPALPVRWLLLLIILLLLALLIAILIVA